MTVTKDSYYSFFSLNGIILIFIIFVTSLSWASPPAATEQKKEDRVIKVHGAAVKKVKSDHASWTIIFKITEKVGTPTTLMYQNAESTRTAIIEFLKKKGLNESEITPHSIKNPFTAKEHEQQKTSPLVGTIEVNSMNVDLIEVLKSSLSDLIKDGIDVTTSNLAYTYSTPHEAELEMVSDALKNARSKADILAKESGTIIDKVITVSHIEKHSSVQDIGENWGNKKKLYKIVTVNLEVTFSIK